MERNATRNRVILRTDRVPTNDNDYINFRPVEGWLT